MSLTEWPERQATLFDGTAALPHSARVYLPPLDELARIWPAIEKMLMRATSRTRCYEPIDLLQMAMLGQAGIWVCEVEKKPVAAMVTKIEQYPRVRVLEMLFCGGNRMKEWLPEAIRAIDWHARASGCQHIACVGRPGWVRAWGGEPTGDIIIVRSLGNQTNG